MWSLQTHHLDHQNWHPRKVSQQIEQQKQKEEQKRINELRQQQQQALLRLQQQQQELLRKKEMQQKAEMQQRELQQKLQQKRQESQVWKLFSRLLLGCLWPVFMGNHPYENAFCLCSGLWVHFHANQTRVYMRSFAPGLVLNRGTRDLRNGLLW